MKGLEPFQHLAPRNAGNRPPLEPWLNMVLVVIHVDSERAWFPVPPVIYEHLVGDRLESDLCRLCGDTLPPFPDARNNDRACDRASVSGMASVSPISSSAAGLRVACAGSSFSCPKADPDPEAFKVGSRMS